MSEPTFSSSPTEAVVASDGRRRVRDRLTTWFAPEVAARERCWLVAVGGAYFLAHQLAFMFPHSAGMLVAVWPAGGIGLAALLLSRRELWPLLLAVLFSAGTAANIWSGRGLMPSLGFMVANAMESGLGAWLLTRLAGPQITLRRVQEVVALVVVAMVVNADTAFIGAGTAALSVGKPFWDFYRSWWIADALGLLLVTPLILLWAQSSVSRGRFGWGRGVELAVLIAVAAVGVWQIFGVPRGQQVFVSHPYMLSLVLVWAALRFELRVVVTLLLFVAVLSVAYTDLGQGSYPLGGHTRSEQLLMVQIFIGIVGVVCLVMAASQTERQAAVEALRQNEARLRAIGNNLPNSMVYQAESTAAGELRFLLVSGGVERLNGLSPESLLKDASLLRRQIVAEDQPVLSAAVAESRRKMEVLNVAVRLRRADGQLRWMRFCAAPRRRADGATVWDGVETDVTELKLTKQALTTSEALLHQFVKYAPAAVAMFDTEMRYLQVSDRWLMDYHLSGREIVGQSHYDLLPDLPEHWRAVHRRVLAGATERKEQEAYPRADGSVEWLQWEVRPWFNGGGQIGGVIMFTQVITERRRVEDALRLSEQRFRSALQNSPIGMGLVSVEGKWLEVNPALCRLVGYAAEELIGQSVELIIPVEEQGGTAGGLMDLMARRMAHHEAEQRCRHQDGSVVWGQLHLSLVRDPDGTTRHYVFQVQNITERKRTMFELIAANTRYAQHEAALSALAHHQVAGPANLTEVLQTICARAAQALEVRRVSIWRYDAARTTIVCDVLYDADGARFSAGMELNGAIFPTYFRALAEGDLIVAHDVEADPRTREMVNAYLRPAGITSMLDVPIHSQGRAVGVMCCEHLGEKRQWKPDEQTFAIAVANFVSMQLAQVARQELEEQFRQAQKLDALGTLAGGIAHDFNNILAAILSFAELAKLDNAANAALQEQLNHILKAGHRAASLVRQILWFSRQQKQSRRPLQLEPVVQEALGLMRATLPATVEIVPNFARSLPEVLADASQIHQVVMNLCANAAHAMQGRQGRLQVQLDALEVKPNASRAPGGVAAGRYLRLAVSDTGCGMDAATRKRIFEPFFTTKAPGEGTGLGLAVVHGIVASHGGGITVQSVPGRGSTFTILLPVVATPERCEPAGRAPVPKGKGQRILFVDDERDLCEAARRMIDWLGYEPVVFNDAEAAWRAIQRQPERFDLIVSDLTMPVLTGADLARNVRQLRPHFPIILTSGYPGALSEERIQELGIRELMPKPLDLQSFAQAIHRALATPPDLVESGPRS